MTAILARLNRDGSDSPLSYRWYDRKRIPSSSATACCVRPRFDRDSLSLSGKPGSLVVEFFIRRILTYRLRYENVSLQHVSL